jgi:hypothetical protein
MHNGFRDFFLALDGFIIGPLRKTHVGGKYDQREQKCGRQ